MHDEHEFPESIQVSSFYAEGARGGGRRRRLGQGVVELGDDTRGVALQFAEVLLDLVDVVDMTDVLVEVADAVHGVDRTRFEGAGGQRKEKDGFGLGAGLSMRSAAAVSPVPAGGRRGM